MHKKILIVAGATASGKSARALSLAQSRDGVIINADSQQMYRELRILTARPTAQEEALVPHRLYGTMAGADNCSAGVWLNFARMEIDWVLSAGKTPIVVGGTGLYIKALMEGIAEIPDVPPQVRAQAVSDYDDMGKDAFAARLREVDPEFFVRLSVYDKQRLVRAWEVWLASGKSLSWWQGRGATPPYAADRFEVRLVELPREELYKRCNERFVAMMEQGAVDEVKQLLSLNLPPDAPIMKSVGVRELSAHMEGKITLEEAITQAQQATRNYAKRQLTWFRHQLGT